MSQHGTEFVPHFRQGLLFWSQDAFPWPATTLGSLPQRWPQRVRPALLLPSWASMAARNTRTTRGRLWPSQASKNSFSLVGKSIVMVLMGGSAMAPSEAAVAASGAIVWAGYGGEEAGTALADVLLGAYNPGGRMPFTSYLSVDDFPLYYNMSMVGAPHGRTYRYFTGPDPVFRFGQGSSYSHMAYSNLSIRGAHVGVFQPCASLNISITLMNHGPKAGDEVIQVYVRMRNAPAKVIVPRSALVAFRRIATQIELPLINNGFLLSPRSFALVDGAGKRWMLYPVDVDVYVGSQQPTVNDWSGSQAATLKMSGPPTPLNSCLS